MVDCWDAMLNRLDMAKDGLVGEVKIYEDDVFDRSPCS